MESAPNTAAGPTKRLITRRRLVKTIAGTLAVPGLTGLYSYGVEPFWEDFHSLLMSVRNLPASFEGFKLVHLTDLHAGDAPMNYLTGVINRVHGLKPDLVVVTGDLVTSNRDWAPAICDLLGTFGPKLAVSFGNHDYTDPWHTAHQAPLCDELEARLTNHGCHVLRNRSLSIDHPDGQLKIVGIEDFWSARFRPATAFAGIGPTDAVIALSHNPDSAPQVDAYGPSWILSGHTHGGQVRVPLLGALILPVRNKSQDQGVFQLSKSRLYVSRGVGYLKRIRFCCRPEIPCFTLTNASASV